MCRGTKMEPIIIGTMVLCFIAKYLESKLQKSIGVENANQY